MEKRNLKGWLYLLPAMLFLGFFMVYPLVDVFIYSFEEGYNSASQTYYGVGLYNYSCVLHDPDLLQAVKNTFILVIFTVPISTGLALLISVGLNSIKKTGSSTIDTENSNLTKLNLNGMIIYRTEKYGQISCTWNDDKIEYTLSYSSDLEWDEVTKIINGIRLEQPE
jgi:ABC-type uncharacterized transport system permease subunit